MIEYYEHAGDAQIAFGWHAKEAKTDAEAVRLAARVDAAVVCVGFNQVTEGEGFDRPFALPKEQEDLIREVAAVNKRTIVVLNAGGNVAVTGWIDNVAALLHAWYPGQEGGTAVAEILFGDVNPSGKLPVSFEKKWEDNATVNSYYDDDKDGHVRYSEGVFLGYRHFDQDNIKPMFPFGFGLSYTAFAYSNFKVTPADLAPGKSATVRFTVKNTGKRAGSEIAEVYVHPVKATVPRPVKELKGFSKVWLKPGESKTVDVALSPRAFAYYDTTQHAWVAEQGTYEVWVGSSSADIRLKGSVAVKEKEVMGYK
jgi:beta-glucosidase